MKKYIPKEEGDAKSGNFTDHNRVTIQPVALIISIIVALAYLEKIEIRLTYTNQN